MTAQAGTAGERQATRVPALRAALRAVRRRWHTDRLLAGAVWSVIATTAIVCAVEAARVVDARLADAEILRAPAALLAAAGAFAIMLALASVRAFWHTPDLRGFARSVDRKMALRERLSTAIEVDDGTAGGPLDPVRNALLADAENHAAAIDPRALVRFGLPRGAWLAPLLIVLAAVLHLIPPDALAARSPAATAAADTGPLNAAEAENAASNLRRVADAVARDAEQRSDPYLRTIAEAIKKLGSDVERAGLDRKQATAALDRLLDHARQAYGADRNPDPGSAPPNALALFETARDDIAGTRPNQRMAASARPDAAGQAQGEAPGRTGAKPSGPATPQRETRPGDTAIGPLGDAAARAGGADDPDGYGGETDDPRTQKERAYNAQQRRMRAESVGAAADAGAGEGDRAGDGTRPLGKSNPLPDDATAGADMLLPDQADNDGRRIRIEMPPSAEATTVAPPLPGSTADWRRAPEQPVARPAFSAPDRKAISRYFARTDAAERPAPGAGTTP